MERNNIQEVQSNVLSICSYFGTLMEPYWKYIYDGNIETLIDMNSYDTMKEVKQRLKICCGLIPSRGYKMNYNYR